jgi:hypothetical protein
MSTTVEEREHALLSPSSAYTWIECAGATAAQLGQPDDSSEYADDGTASHELAKWCLTDKVEASLYIGRVIKVGEREFEVDEERAEFVQLYVDAIDARIEALELAGAQVELRIEERLSIEHITGEPGAKGTSDAVIIATWPDGRAELEVRDLKYGRGVEVSAERNYQAMIYAGGAYEEYSSFVDFDRVRLVIHQPRVNPDPSEWEASPAELLGWLGDVAEPAAARALDLMRRVQRGEQLEISDLNPGEKQCRFCKAKAVCPALARHVENTIGADFDTIGEDNQPANFVPVLGLNELGTIYPALPLIDSWGKAVLARIEYELLNGNPVPGVKLVQGRRGARQWSSVEEAEKLLKSMRLKNDEMYNFKVISPTQAEKLLAKDSPRRWKKAEALVVQREGSPSVAPESDKRPALVIAPPADDFEPVTVEDDGSDLT